MSTFDCPYCAAAFPRTLDGAEEAFAHVNACPARPGRNSARSQRTCVDGPSVPLADPEAAGAAAWRALRANGRCTQPARR